MIFVTALHQKETWTDKRTYSVIRYPKPFQMLYDAYRFLPKKQRHHLKQYVSPITLGDIKTFIFYVYGKVLLYNLIFSALHSIATPNTYEVIRPHEIERQQSSTLI